MPSKRPKSDRGPGRPYITRTFYDRIWLAEMLDNWTEEFREAGSKRPFKDAVLTYLDFASGDDERAYGAPHPKAIPALREDKKRFAAYVRNIKKRRRRGLLELQRFNEHRKAAGLSPAEEAVGEEEEVALPYDYYRYCLIFDSFPSIERAREFAAAVKECYGLDGRVFDDIDACEQRPPIVHINHPPKYSKTRDRVVAAIEKLAKKYGGNFAGTN